jgi:uncharacterized membrane protein
MAGVDMNKGINYRLKVEREKRGWSQARVAEQIDTDAINVSRWERGYSTPTPYFREKLCRLYEKNAQELGFLDDEPEETLPSADPEPEPAPTASPENHSSPDPERPDRNARRLACLGYLFLWLGGLYVFLLSRGNRFARYHSLQSALFFGGSNLLSTVILVVMGIMVKMADQADKPALTAAFMVLLAVLALINLFSFSAWIIAILQAGRGNYYSLPFVSGLRESILRVSER